MTNNSLQKKKKEFEITVFANQSGYELQYLICWVTLNKLLKRSTFQKAHL